jgi:hypothetical protein
MTSHRTRGTAAWLDLARRHRQHRLDEQAPELLSARDAERAGEDALAVARTELDTALDAQRRAASAASLSLDLLRLHGSHCARLRDDADAAAQAAQAAREAADALRARAARDLAERDAFRQRMDDQADAAQQDAQRRAARTIDELWLLGSGATGKGGQHAG